MTDDNGATSPKAPKPKPPGDNEIIWEYRGLTTADLTSDTFIQHLHNSDSPLRIAVYEQNIGPRLAIRRKTFRICNFSKSSFRECTFTDCRFVQCGFIGTAFEDCEFHNCSFSYCNPNKARFERTYLDPDAFAHNGFHRKQHANVSAGLFQRLLNTARAIGHRRFADSAEYHYRIWERRLQWIEALDRNRALWQRLVSLRRYTTSLVHYAVAGYGVRIGRLLAWTVVLVTVMTLLNRALWPAMAMTGGPLLEPGSRVAVPAPWSLVFYYTLATLTTTGLSGIYPASALGWTVSGLESLVGLVWFALCGASVVKKVVG